MPQGVPVTPATFAGVQNVDIDSLSSLPEAELRPILPCLVRMSLCAPLDASAIWTQERKKILKCLSGIEIVNSLVGLLSIDFHELEQDAKKELQIRAKIGGNPTESHVIAALPQGIALEFERCDAARKLRLLLSELLFIMYQINQPRPEFYQKSSELFESEVYLEEVSDVLCIAQAELPSLLPIVEITDVLLHVRNGPWLLCRVVANAPDTFQQVCSSLVSGGEEQDEETINGQCRTTALLMLCDMCPSYALTARSLCVKHCKQPSVAVRLTIQHQHKITAAGDSSMNEVSEVVAFVSGLLLDNNSRVRNWFSQYIRTGLKKKDSSSSVAELRQKILDELSCILPPSPGSKSLRFGDVQEISESNVVQGCAFIRLYSALKCIAGLKFSDDENHSLLRLITCRPPPTKAGVRFASLGLCVLLACPSIISNSEQKTLVVDWIRWLVRQAEHFELMSGVRASFGGMLLLIGIHFHSSQTNAINDLVSATLGMKSSLKSNALAYMKTVFTQEIFNEQVVTAHAVKVAVTKDLNADVTGYLPVHCMFHLLRSRTFAKHQVRITEWIYQQLCQCTAPIHSVVPSLIEAFVTSIIVPAARGDCTNEPIPEEQLLRVFEDPFSLRASGAGQVEDTKNSTFTTHLLLVYYLLLHEDMLLSNMATIISCNRKVHRYSAQLMGRLPIKYVLQQSQKEPALYGCIYQPLLRLVATHYPHHCLVGDWLNEETADRLGASLTVLLTSNATVTVDDLGQAFRQLPSSSSHCASLLDQLLTKSSIDLMPFRNVLVCNLSRLLETGVSRHCQDLVQKIWLKMNALYSTNLRSETVNALRRRNSSCSEGKAKDDYTNDDIIKDPLIVLRCDDRVFRCPPLMEITLGNLEAFLQASRSYLTKHMQANPIVDRANLGQTVNDRETLRNALVAAQESAAVHILLECCLPRDDSEKNATGLLSDWREIQGIVCSHLHQMFIADPGLTKLVHFQGYPRELLPLTVAGIPSMHICLDFVEELISLPHLDKQIFAIDLVSYLSLQYALPKSLTVAKIAVNVMGTMLGVLSFDARPDFFIATLASLVRICRTFPPLCDDSVTLLIRLGRIVHSHLSTLSGADIGSFVDSVEKDAKLIQHNTTLHSRYASLYAVVFQTFAEIVGSTTLLRHQLQ